MKLGDIIVLSFELVFYTFHISLLIMLIFDYKTKFQGAFYNMLRMLFITDILIFLSSFEARIATYGFWPEYFRENTFFPTLNLQSSFYLFMMQFLVHAFIPLNRFTLFWFPFLYKKLWSKQWYTIAIFVIPLIILSPWLQNYAIFVFTEKGNVIVTYPNPDDMASVLFMSFIYCCTITAISAILNLLAIIKYYIQRKRGSHPVQLKEITFLYMSCALFVAHCVYCVTMVGRTMFINNPKIAYLFQSLLVIIMDVIAWSGSISLILISKHARKNYIEFYKRFLRKKQILVKISHTSKTVLPNQKS